MWICVGPRDPATKPSRGRLDIAKTKAAARFYSWNYCGTEVINENPNQDAGCLCTDAPAVPSYETNMTETCLLRPAGTYLGS